MSSESGTSAGTSASPQSGKPRLLAQIRDAIRRRYYSRRTEEAYVHWIKRFIWFHGRRHPRELGEAEVTAFLNDLAANRNVAAGTQNQALSALLFLYKEVLGLELAWLDGLQRPTRPPRLPTVLTRSEVERLLAQLTGTRWLMASLMYGGGLRLMECLRLRVKDVDLSYRQILVRDGKGEKDRVTMLPETLVEPLRAHLERVRALHARDLAEGYGEVNLPYALARKYPRAGREWAWQFVFPSKNRSAEPEDGTLSAGIHVSGHKSGGYAFDVAKCDIKERSRRHAKTIVRLYRVRRDHGRDRPQLPARDRSFGVRRARVSADAQSAGGESRAREAS